MREQICQKPRSVSKRQSGFENLVSGIAEYSEKMDNADTQLERGDESICHTFRGTSADERIRHKLIYTDFLTPSKIF